jgi:hypothetical protein
MDHDHPDHRFARLGEGLVIFTQAAVAIEPPQGALDNPPLRAHRKALGALGPLDNLQPYGVMPPPRLDPRDQLAGIGLIGPDHPPTRARVPEEGQHGFRPVTIWHTRRGDDDGQEHPERGDPEMPLAAFDRFVDLKAAEPPVSVVLTDWRARIPARGWRRVPAAPRTAPRSTSGIRCQGPSWRQRQKYW